LHYYSFRTALFDEEAPDSRFCPTEWKVSLLDSTTGSLYEEDHYSFMHKFGSKELKKW